MFGGLAVWVWTVGGLEGWCVLRFAFGGRKGGRGDIRMVLLSSHSCRDEYGNWLEMIFCSCIPSAARAYVFKG